jgi:hypothetical protein
MSALKLATCIDAGEPFSHAEVSDMLRKQNAAIKQLREALTFVSRYTNAKPAAEHAQAALAATEGMV